MRGYCICLFIYLSICVYVCIHLPGEEKVNTTRACMNVGLRGFVKKMRVKEKIGNSTVYNIQKVWLI